MNNKALEADETSSLTNQLVLLSQRVNPAMKRLNTWGRASLAGEAQSRSPQGVKVVGKARMGQGCEQLKDPETRGLALLFGGPCVCTVPICLQPSLPKQQATQNFPSELGEDGPLRGSLVASFLGLFVGKTEVTSHKNPPQILHGYC